MPSIIRSRAPGIARAVSRPPTGRTSGSVGAVDDQRRQVERRSRPVRLPEQLIACSWRATPGGWKLRS